MDTQPTLVYPPDGVLLPPNMNTVSIQWMAGTGNTQFEIDLSNPATDVKINTKCMPTVDTRGTMSGGCQLDLSGAMWDFVAGSNRGGDPIKVTVQGTSNGTCAAPGANSVAVAFSEQDVAGGVYYWKSTVTTSGTGGQIWSKSFGDSMPEQQITGMNNLGSSCNGCHSLSRDGLRMTINADDSHRHQCGSVGKTRHHARLVDRRQERGVRRADVGGRVEQRVQHHARRRYARARREPLHHALYGQWHVRSGDRDPARAERPHQ
jgi:hypothetical protein